MDHLDLSFPREEHNLAQALTAFRNRYLAANKQQRQTVREWVAALATLNGLGRSLAGLPQTQVGFELWESLPDPHGGKETFLPAVILARAIDAWDKDEPYLLTLADILDD